MSGASETQRAFGEPLGDGDLQKAWPGVAEKRLRRRRRRARQRAAGGVAGGVALLAALAVATVQVLPEDTGAGPLTLADGSAFTDLNADAERALPLSDGSRLTLAPGTRGEVVVNDGRRVMLVLEEGRAHFDVVPSGPRAWGMDAGSARVEVLGTAFEVALTPERATRVSVERGHVLVVGPSLPGGSAHLHGGDAVLVEP
ncbi:MAG: FecR family protein, partial [Myxococcota bacterium]